MQEVSRARSTSRKPFQRNLSLKGPIGKERIHRKKLPPQYVAGFIDGEGSFAVSVGKRKERDYKHPRSVEIRAEFEIELRADDREILERILVTIGCGKIYDCSYERYGWYPHAKYKITSSKDLVAYLFPFLDANHLQAKKAKTYILFKRIVTMYRNKEHLTDKGFSEMVRLREQMRFLGKKHSMEAARIR
ncbi:MAG: LAGLIDADG family homing endonuclease [Candidatus Spechtbacteria bacterium]|nr:LAGLIDADG family homing endonuclease [Candidatus Spechtbacteria bacterium]